MLLNQKTDFTRSSLHSTFNKNSAKVYQLRVKCPHLFGRMEDYGVEMQCRACLSTNSAEYIDMESSMTRGYTILECFNICTNLRAEIPDQLPLTICSLCSHDLQVAFDFLQVSRQADAVLREHLASQKNGEVIYKNDDEMERLEYVESVESFVGVVAPDEVEEGGEGEQMLELHLVQEDEEEEDNHEEQKIEFVEECYETMDNYRELEAIEEQMMNETTMEHEYLEEKPQVEQLDLDMQHENVAANKRSSKANNLKGSKHEIPESYPEDEIDDEYLLEHNENADNSFQGWKCFECKRVLHSDVSYEGHLNMHKNVKPYKCKQCRSTFRCRNALEHHANKRHNHDKKGQKCFTCDLCNKPFRLATLLLEHRRAEHKTLESCTRCSKSFKSKDLLDEHMTLIHPPTNATPIQCPYCEQPPLTKPRLVEHLRLHHPAEHRKHVRGTVGRPCDENKVTPWQCEECFRYYRTEMLLKDHRNTHNNERPHTCTVCEKRFFTANNLRSHMRSIHQAEYEKRLAESLDTMVQCNVCRKKLLQKNLGKHVLTHERKEKQQSAEGSTAKYLCAYCPKSFTNQAKLSKHEEVHNPERPRSHSCDYCTSKFFSQYDKMHHVRRVHQANNRAFTCSICSNAYKEKSQLRNHLMLHTQKNIQCALCDKKYARQTDLQVHMRSHTGELPYACHLCERRFAIKVRLTYHLQKHLGIKHNCNECGKSCNSRGKLRMHLFKHRGMPYRCEDCPEAQFSKRERFRLHLTRVHNRIPSEDELTANFERNTGRAMRIKELLLHGESEVEMQTEPT